MSRMIWDNSRFQRSMHNCEALAELNPCATWVQAANPVRGIDPVRRDYACVRFVPQRSGSEYCSVAGECKPGAEGSGVRQMGADVVGVVLADEGFRAGSFQDRPD